MALNFRNVDCDPASPVESWPFEALVIAVERGAKHDYRRIARAAARSPRVREDVLAVCDILGNEGGALVVRSLVEGAPREVLKDESVREMERAVRTSGLTQREAARWVGIPQARLSEYLAGKRTPGVDIYLRILQLARLTDNPLAGFTLPSQAMSA